MTKRIFLISLIIFLFTRFGWTILSVPSLKDTIGAGGCVGCGGAGVGSLLTSVLDAKGQITKFEYDKLGRLVAAGFQPAIKTFTYDSVGNLISVTDAKGQTITFTYDSLNRLVTKSLPDDTVNYTYDAIGNLTSIQNQASSIQMSYDTLNRVISVTCHAELDSASKTLSYTYDANGNRTSIVTPFGNYNYVYDNLNRLTSLTNSVGQSFNFAYDSLSRRTKMTYPNGIVTNYTYDSVSQLNVIAIGSEAISYVYNGAGNRTSMTDPLGTHNYTYDNLYRLTNAQHPSMTAESFTYDSVGNRLTSHISANYIYDTTNRLTSDDQYTYEYDANGNMIKRVVAGASPANYEEFTYNSENQLTKYEVIVGTNLFVQAEYKYDGLGRRIEKNVDGVITRYIYDNEDILFELNGLNNIQAQYTHGSGIDEPLMMKRSNGGVWNDYYYSADGLGSIVNITDETGAIIEKYVYDSFGNITIKDASNNTLTQSAVGNSYTYTAREYDSETGLFYYRARYYDFNTGRFLQEDPIGFYGGINFYSYAKNNPVNYIDPHGLKNQNPCDYCPEGLWIGQGFTVGGNFFTAGKVYTEMTFECLSNPGLKVKLKMNTTLIAAGVGGGIGYVVGASWGMFTPGEFVGESMELSGAGGMGYFGFGGTVTSSENPNTIGAIISPLGIGAGWWGGYAFTKTSIK